MLLYDSWRRWLNGLARLVRTDRHRERRTTRGAYSARRRVRPCLESLEERLTPSTDLVFATAWGKLTAGDPSGAIVVRLQDNNGGLVNAPAGGVTLYLSSTSPTSEFLDTSGNPLANMPGGSGPSVFIPEGQSEASFEYVDTNGGQNGGRPTLTVAAAGYTSATGQGSVNLPAGNIIHVSTLNDNGDNDNPLAGSLRSAINAANTEPGSTIVFDVTGIIDLGGTDLPILAQSTRIFGPGADKLTIKNGLFTAGADWRGFATATIEVDDLAFTGNHHDLGYAMTVLANASDVTLRRLDVYQNDQGIFHPLGNLVIDACDVHHNGAFAYEGPKQTGAGLDAQAGNITVINSNIHDNTGIGMAWANGNYFTGLPTGTISYSTIVDNQDTGIVNAGIMKLQNVLVSGNHGAGSNVGFRMPGDPGGILNVVLNGSTSLDVENSTIINNSTSDPGTAAGIDSENGTTLRVVNSTISGNVNNNTNNNSGRANAGGIGVYGGIATISFSTIAGNTVNTQSGFNVGGGVATFDGARAFVPTPGQEASYTIVGGAVTTIDDTIVAGNTGSSASNPDVAGTFTSKGYNLIGASDATGNGFSSAKHDQTGTVGRPLDPKLDALHDNGGPTPTMALLTGSPALGEGNASMAPPTDQRGVTRPQQVSDVGAFQATTAAGPVLSPIPLDLLPTTVGVFYTKTFTAGGAKAIKQLTGQFTSDADGLSFALDNGSLILSGIPTAAGTVTFTVSATDVSDSTTTLTYNLTVNGPVTLTPASGALPDGVMNTTYNQTIQDGFLANGEIIRTGGGTGKPYYVTYQFTNGSNADGLNFFASTYGLSISGKPTAAGTISFDVTATDSVGASTTQSYMITVNATGMYPITLTPNSLPPVSVGQFYMKEIDALNGTGDKTVKLTPVDGTTLPNWLSVNDYNPDKVSLQGTPTLADIGSFSFDVTATDINNQSTTQRYTLTINDSTSNPAPTVTDVLPKSGPAEGGTMVTITGSGFTNAIAVNFGDTKLTGNAFFALNDNYMYVFTPPGSAGSVVHVIVTTPDGTSATSEADQFTYLATQSSITISPDSLNAGTTGVSYSQIFTASGGTGNKTVTGQFTSAANGLSFSQGTNTVTLSGTPAAAGNVTFDVTATDEANVSTTKSYTLTINDRATNPAAVVAGVSPNSGVIAGGTLVTITGLHFTGATAVKFGTTDAASFQVVNDMTIKAIAPAHAAGAVDITVTTASGGTSATSSADQFTYVAPRTPFVTGLTMNSGPTSGGALLFLQGSGFTGASSVKFGTTNAMFFVLSDNLIQVFTPAHAAGAVAVTVANGTGTSIPGKADQYTYLAPGAPAVTSLSVASGPASGGTPVTIHGSGFNGTTAVQFGTTNATNVVVVSNTTITATAPAGAGTVDVTVTTPIGVSATSAADRYTFVPAPVVMGITPTGGSTAGGTQVTITGSGLTGVTAVKFGANSATSFTVVNDTTITAIAPAGAAGLVHVTVTSVGGNSGTSAVDQFTYVIPAPAITSLSPASGPQAGGTVVTITGSGFTGATAVKFGADNATNVTVLSDSRIQATAPAGTGTVNVQVITPGGTSAIVAADQFSYVVVPAPVVTAVAPNSGLTTGGTTVTITGSGFTGVTAVQFGATTATSFTVVNDTTITAVAPALSAGTVDVKVTGPGGTSGTGIADRFTYVAVETPFVTGLSSPSGPASGGSMLLINGSGFTGTTSVKFGATNATMFLVLSDNMILALAPPHASGQADVIVTKAIGASIANPSDRFTYF
jgi:hypothetical protein